MTSSLVLRRAPRDALTKDVGENVFLSDLPDDYKIFAFYYPSTTRDPALEGALRGLGELTGRNLFVTMGSLADPAFDKIISAFQIKRFPVIIMTATADLAGSVDAHVNVFARLDHSQLLSDSDRAITLVQELYALFLTGDIAAAISKAKWTQRSELLRAVGEVILRALRGIAGFVADRDIKFSLLDGSFELVKSSG